MTQNTEAKMCAFRCGRPVHDGKRLCEVHLEHQRIKMAEYRQQRKKLGKCSRCPNKARLMSDGTPSTLCEGCRDHVRTLEQKGRDRQVRQAKKVVRLRSSGLTLKQISTKVKLTHDQIKVILARF